MKYFTLLFLILTTISAKSFSQTLKESVIVKIFFIDTYGNSKKVSERKKFSENKKYTFCYDSEGFDNLQLSGNATNLSITVTKKDDFDQENNSEKMIYYKSEFDLKGIKKFTDKDFDFMVGKRYFITIIQNDTLILFKGEIDSQGCM